MPYSPPNLATFRALYPAFDAVADATVQAWLDKGETETANWPDADRDDGIMLFTAHRLTTQGLGSGAIPSGVTSFKSGTFSATVSDGLASKTGFAATSYGRDYIALAKRLFGGPHFAWTPPTNV